MFAFVHTEEGAGVRSEDRQAGSEGLGEGEEKTRDEAFCSFLKLALLCAVGPSQPPTWDWGHLSAEIGASRWHFIWKYTQSCSELTRASEGCGDRQIHELDHSHQEQETKGQLGTADTKALGLYNTETPWPLENTNSPKRTCFHFSSSLCSSEDVFFPSKFSSLQSNR